MKKNSPAPSIPGIINDLMSDHGLRPSELAEITNMPYSTVMRIVSRRTDNPSAKTLIALSKYFKVSVDYLLGLQKEKGSPFNESQKASAKKASSSFKIPVISWTHVKQWLYQGETSLDSDHNHWILAHKKTPPDAFALKIDNAIYKPTFPKNSTIIVVPKRKYTEDEYVLASINKRTPTIRYISSDSDKIYLRAVSVDIPSEPLETPHVVFGKIEEYRVPTG